MTNADRGEGNAPRVLGLPIDRALGAFEGVSAPSVIEIHPPRGARQTGTLRVIRYDAARNELTVARFIDTVDRVRIDGAKEDILKGED